jgi:predicted metal-binding protein
MIPKEHFNRFKEKAKELGANRVLIIPAGDIVVESRTVLKCIFGCNGWGSHVCPPYVPTVDEFKGMLKDYQWALLADWKSENYITKEISENFIKYGLSPPEDPETAEAYQKIKRTLLKERKERIQPGSLELEKLAWTMGYSTALATFPGMCAWCANADYSAVSCAKDRSECHHQALRRPCLMGLGIRLDKTLERLKIEPISFPIENGIPKQYTLLLIE